MGFSHFVGVDGSNGMLELDKPIISFNICEDRSSFHLVCTYDEISFVINNKTL